MTKLSKDLLALLKTEGACPNSFLKNSAVLWIVHLLNICINVRYKKEKEPYIDSKHYFCY